jgi:hypothetical protein
MQRYLFGTACLLLGLGCSTALDDEPASGDNSSAIGTQNKDGKSAADDADAVKPDLDPCEDGKPGEPPNTKPGRPKPGKPRPTKPGEPPKPGYGVCITTPAPEVCKEPDGKLIAQKICSSKGLEVRGIILDPKGGCSITCCDSDTAPPPPLPPPPKPPPPADEPPSECTGTAIGDGVTCIDWGTLKTKAAAICEGQGAYVSELAVYGECEDGAAGAKLLCCKPSEKLPPSYPAEPAPK